MKITAVIVARGGTKGFPKKKVELLGNRPLVSHIIKEPSLAQKHQLK